MGPVARFSRPVNTEAMASTVTSAGPPQTSSLQITISEAVSLSSSSHPLFAANSPYLTPPHRGFDTLFKKIKLLLIFRYSFLTYEISNKLGWQMDLKDEKRKILLKALEELNSFEFSQNTLTKLFTTEERIKLQKGKIRNETKKMLEKVNKIIEQISAANNQLRLSVTFDDVSDAIKKGADSTTIREILAKEIGKESTNIVILKLLISTLTPEELLQPIYGSGSLLQTAIMSNKKKIIYLLLYKAIELKKVEDLEKFRCGINYKTTPLHFATRYGSKKIVKLLLMHLPKHFIWCRDENGHTPLYTATQLNRKTIIILLIVAQLKEFNKEGGLEKFACNNTTPLHLAAEYKDYELVRIFLYYLPESFIDCSDCDGNKPFHIAAKNGSRRIFKWLISYAAEENILDKNTKGKSILDLVPPKYVPQVTEFIEQVRSIINSARERQIQENDSKKQGSIHTLMQAHAYFKQKYGVFSLKKIKEIISNSKDVFGEKKESTELVN